MPSAEVLSIGTELLLGQVLDTNAQYFAIELAKLGINAFYRTTVGDNKQRIRDALTHALQRSDILITSGGLGPTADDLTTECIAELFGAPQTMDEAIIERIQAFFAMRNVKMPETNRKQGLRPDGADWLPNPVGTAPGIIWDVDAKLLDKLGVNAPRVILTFPGVPSEMRAMWAQTAEPYLRKRYGASVLWSCELKHFGIGESALAEKYSHLLDLENPTVAPYAGRGECRLRVTAKATDVEAAKKMAQPVIDEIRNGSGPLLYGTDAEMLEEVVGRLLASNGWKISCAESCTGGLISKRLTDVPGSSKYAALNLVTYANEAKQQMLGVSDETLTKFGAVSPECARAMAEGLQKLTKAELALSVTGIAGPDGGTADKPVGLVYLGLMSNEGYFAKKLLLPKEFSRDDIRFRTASEALNMVRLFLLDPKLLEKSKA